MTPTVEMDNTASSWELACSENVPYVAEVNESGADMNEIEVFVSSRSLDNHNDRICRLDVTQIQRPTIPDASSAFRETMGRIKSEQAQKDSTNSSNNNNMDTLAPTSAPSSPSSSSSSFINKLKSAFKSSSTSSSNFSNNSRSLQLTLSGKSGGSRRPASFGGVDVVKPWTGRRASQSEKRVSWADELGSNRALISVKLIKPRISMSTKPIRQTVPGHSILRNTGLH